MRSSSSLLLFRCAKQHQLLEQFEKDLKLKEQKYITEKKKADELLKRKCRNFLREKEEKRFSFNSKSRMHPKEDSQQMPQASPPCSQMPQASQYGPQMPQASQYGPQMPQVSQYGRQVPQASKYGPKMLQASQYGPQVPQVSQYGTQVPQASQYGIQVPQASQYGPQVTQATQQQGNTLSLVITNVLIPIKNIWGHYFSSYDNSESSKNKHN